MENKKAKINELRESALAALLELQEYLEQWPQLMADEIEGLSDARGIVATISAEYRP